MGTAFQASQASICGNLILRTGNWLHWPRPSLWNATGSAPPKQRDQ